MCDISAISEEHIPDQDLSYFGFCMETDKVEQLAISPQM